MNGSEAHLSLETVAAITAALSVVLDRPVGSFVVKSIQAEQSPALPPASVWAKAGVFESHLARRQFGFR